jgi:hypothetical protein
MSTVMKPHLLPSLLLIASVAAHDQNNVHVTFGDAPNCIAPACGRFSLNYTVIESAFAPYFASSASSKTFSYCGAWWATNVGSSNAVASDFCTNGAGASQTCSNESYHGVTLALVGEGYTIQSYNEPLHEAENYCSVQGRTLPLTMTSTFNRLREYTLTTKPGNQVRSDISHQVGVAVNGVLFSSPFTGISTVAVFDEELDTNIGHPINQVYHYHGYTPAILNEDITTVLAATAHSKIMGMAFDGFPIYGPVGYSTALDKASALKLLVTGYECSTCTTDTQRAVRSNWVYKEGSGDLDECGGRYGLTPDFVGPIYYYVLSVDGTGTSTFPGLPYCLQTANTTPSMVPSASPSTTPVAAPSIATPTATPSASPLVAPSASPLMAPSASPVAAPSASLLIAPSASPITTPSGSPQTAPSDSPLMPPSASPIAAPSASPLIAPSASPITTPSGSPQTAPSDSPLMPPSASPIAAPSASPLIAPSASPITTPSGSPQTAPSASPLMAPSASPIVAPSASPLIAPSATPVVAPSTQPVAKPTSKPTAKPTAPPTLGQTTEPTVDCLPRKKKCNRNADCCKKCKKGKKKKNGKRKRSKCN